MFSVAWYVPYSIHPQHSPDPTFEGRPGRRITGCRAFGHGNAVKPLSTGEIQMRSEGILADETGSVKLLGSP